MQQWEKTNKPRKKETKNTAKTATMVWPFFVAISHFLWGCILRLLDEAWSCGARSTRTTKPGDSQQKLHQLQHPVGARCRQG